MKMYILDTNIVITFLNGNSYIAEKLSNITYFIPVVVLGELYFGAYKSQRQESNIKLINEFLSECKILNTDETTSKYYGEIKCQLIAIGKPIPENDIWIAALAKQHNCILITNDIHFENIQDLIIENWIEEK